MADTYKISVAFVDTDGDIRKQTKDFYAATPAAAKAKATEYFTAVLVSIPGDKIIMSEAKPVTSGNGARSVQINGGNATGVQITTGDGSATGAQIATGDCNVSGAYQRYSLARLSRCVIVGDLVGGSLIIGDKIAGSSYNVGVSM